MNKLGKNLKLSCIACLFVGLAAIVVGIVAGIQELFDVDALATIVCGIGATPAGAQASRLANVPNNASKVRTISLIVLVATIAFGVVAYLMGNPTPLQLGALALVAVASLAMLVFSHRMVKDLERV
jgi:O-antigen/teichoic acid export membrane protein